MAIALGQGEPVAGPWRVASLIELVRMLIGTPPSPSAGRPWIVAIDGRGAGGKSTLAERLRRIVPGTQIVHTDDIAWNHARFAWPDLMIDGVLEPVHDGRAVHFQPPAWPPHGRTGHIDVVANAPVVLIEGVGASRQELTPWIDVAVWIQSDFADAERRGIRRDGGDEEAVRNWHEWMAEEVPFLAADRPWDRADVIVGGSNQVQHNPTTQVLLAPPLSAG